MAHRENSIMKHPFFLMLGLAISFLVIPLPNGQANPPENPQSQKLPPEKPLSPQELADFIDQEIAAEWAKNKVKPAPLADDAEFLRRVYLDLAGRIPRVSEAHAFFKNPAKAKRAQQIDSLLADSLHVKHFTNTWTDLILPQQDDLRLAIYNRSFQQWVWEKVEDNTPYDEMVRELLTAPTSLVRKPGQPFNPYSNATLAFYRANENKPENVAAATSRLFLGVRLECAQCHDHPFAEWKRDQFWEYAAFFANVKQQRPVGLGQNQPQNIPTNLRMITIPGTKKTVDAKFLNGQAPNWQPNDNPREVLAAWLTSPENPYFARTAVNRLWAHFFGIGLIEPIDEEPTGDNPPSHPRLLKEMTRQFIAHKFDVQYLIRAITLSQTYQRSSVMTDPSQKESRLFARMSLRGLTPEQLFESLAVATGYQGTNTNVDGRITYNPNSAKSRFLLQFSSTDPVTEKQTSILQALSLMNGEIVSDATSLERSRTLAAVVHAPFFDNREKIKILYLATLTRYPRPEELDRLVKYVNNGGPRHDSQAALADVFWALLNSSEFSLNH